jgi:hypothetical protein
LDADEDGLDGTDFCRAQGGMPAPLRYYSQVKIRVNLRPVVFKTVSKKHKIMELHHEHVAHGLMIIYDQVS